MLRSAGNRLGIVFMVVALLIGCSPGIEVRSDWDRSARFDDLHTWSWLPGQRSESQTEPHSANDARLPDPLLQRRIQSAVEDGLAARGYAQAVAGEPDFYVAYHVAIDEKLDAHTVYPGYNTGPYTRVYPGQPETYVDSYEVGTLLIDVLDPASKQLLWRGVAQSRVQDLKDPAEREARVREAVNRVLAKFPPQSS